MSKPTILVVDDDQVVTKMLKKWLDVAGYNTLVATTAAEGWQLLQDNSDTVSLVITDANMPGEFDGFGLLDRIVKLGAENGVGVIMMSGEGKDTATRGVTLGSNDFMAKPLIHALLLRKVEMLIQHRNSQIQVRQGRLEKQELLKEIESLSARVNGTSRMAPMVETPIQLITHSLTSLLAQEGLADDVREELMRIKIMTLNGGNLYQPSAVGGTDAVTRSYLLNELAIDSGTSTAQPAPLFAVDFIRTTEDISRWTFNVFEHSEDELLVLAKQMFVQLDLLKAFNIKPEVLERFLLSVRQHYNANPYHNWRHAFDVTQAAFCYLIQFEGHKLLTPLDSLALMIGSLCHDIGHPGVNNAFMVSTLTDLAILYNDASVLENYHAATLFQLLKTHPDMDVLHSLTKEQFREVRKSIIECIVATDSAIHYEYVAKLAAKIESDKPFWNRDVPAERLLLLKCIIKMADISNVAREWDRGGKEWSLLVTEEFFSQGDREKSMDLAVAPFMDRNATTVFKNSINFIDFVAAPFFKNMGRLDAKFNDNVVATLLSNRARWEKESQDAAKLAERRN